MELFSDVYSTDLIDKCIKLSKIKISFEKDKIIS